MIEAKLFVLDQEITLIQTEMRYSRSAGRFGVDRTSEVVGGKIALTFETLEDSHDLMHWITRANGGSGMSEKSKMEEGKVCFYDNGFDSAPTKTYEFNDAYLVHYREYFNRSTDTQMLTTMVISPAIQKYGGIEHIESWNVSYVPPSEDAYQPTDNPERILECYYTDSDGNKNAEPEIGDEVYLVLVTENKIGQTIDIDLSDHSKDFLYNGELLEDDMIKGFTISSSNEKIKLEIISPQSQPINAQ